MKPNYYLNIYKNLDDATPPTRGDLLFSELKHCASTDAADAAKNEALSRLGGLGALGGIYGCQAEATVIPAEQVPFISAMRTGTGSPESIAHGLGKVPSAVFVVVQELPPLPDIVATAATLWTPGTHTSNNAVVTVLDGLDYYLVALP